MFNNGLKKESLARLRNNKEKNETQSKILMEKSESLF